MSKYAYKILKTEEWDALKLQGEFEGSPIDLQDGYIHMSLADQVQETLDKHYKSSRDVVIACVDLSCFGPELKFEASRGGAQFPHLYAKLPRRAVTAFKAYRANATGQFTFHADDLSTGL